MHTLIVSYDDDDPFDGQWMAVSTVHNPLITNRQPTYYLLHIDHSPIHCLGKQQT